MATQVGVGASKLLIYVGAGLGGTYILKNHSLTEILGEIRELLGRLSESKEVSDGDAETVALLSQQIQRLTQQVRYMASSRPITVLNGNGTSGNLSSLLLPAAAIGAMGYGYMWWKGLSFSDLMYVTKRNMANAVANVTKQLEQVSAALAATKRHLTQRIEGLDGKLDEQKEISKLIKNDVFEVREDLQQIGFDLDAIHQMVAGLEGKIGTLEHKQDYANAGVMYLCQFVGGFSKDDNMKQFLETFPAKARLEQAPGASDAPKGLQCLMDDLSGMVEKKKLDALPSNASETVVSKNESRTHRNGVFRQLTRASLNRTVSLDQ